MLSCGTSVAQLTTRAEVARNARKSAQFTGLSEDRTERDRDGSRCRRETGLVVSVNRHVELAKDSFDAIRLHHR